MEQAMVVPVEAGVQELQVALVQAALAREEQALRIASLEAELEVLRQERGWEILEKANSQAAKFLSSLTTGTTDPLSPRS
jgi:hypothetical protein